MDDAGKRCAYLDGMRLFALLCVLVYHVSSLQWQTAPVEGAHWQTLNVYNTLTGFCVQLFVMLSGAVWLSRETVSTPRLYRRAILRIVTAYVFWSLLYALLHSFGRDFLYHVPFDGVTVRDCFRMWVTGRYHLWFCFMIVGLYVLLPLLRAMTRDDRLLDYFIAVGAVFFLLLPALCSLPGLSKLSALTDKAGVVFFSGYVYWFVLGYWLYRRTLPKWAVWALMLCGLAASVYLTVYSCLAAPALGRGMAAPGYSVCQALRLCGVFLLFREGFSRIPFSARGKRRLASLSGLCFGAYLVHDFFLWAINKVVPTDLFLPALSVPLLAIVETALSLLAAWLVRKLPGIGRYVT